MSILVCRTDTANKHLAMLDKHDLKLLKKTGNTNKHSMILKKIYPRLTEKLYVSCSGYQKSPGSAYSVTKINYINIIIIMTYALTALVFIFERDFSHTHGTENDS